MRSLVNERRLVMSLRSPCRCFADDEDDGRRNIGHTYCSKLILSDYLSACDIYEALMMQTGRSASANGDLGKVLVLLQAGVDINGMNIFNRTPLQVVKLGDSLLVETLLAAGANPNARDLHLNLTVTHDAAREGFVDTVRALLHNGADVNLVDNKGNLPLHLAAREGHLEVVRLLLGLTANPEATNQLGLTAAQLAQDSNQTETANYIQEFLNSRL